MGESTLVLITEIRTARTTLGYINRSSELRADDEISTPELQIRRPHFPIEYQPTEASIYLTPDCNLSCSYCYIVPFLKGTDKTSRLTTFEWKRVMDELYRVGVRTLKLIGGEPLMRGDLAELIRYADARGYLGLELTTNATIALIRKNKESLQALASAKATTIVSASLDSADPCYNDLIRGKYQDVVDGLTEIAQMGLPLSVATVVTKINRHQLRDLVKLSIRIGASVHQFNGLVPIFSDQRSLVVTDRDEISETNNVVESLKFEFREQITVVNRFVPAPNNQPQVYLKNAKQPDLARSSLTGCPAGTREVYVLPDGRLIACPMFIQLPQHHSSKSLRDAQLEEIWEHDTAICDFREEVTTPKLYGSCASCQSGSLCKGGCRAMTYFLLGDMTHQDPRCLY